MTILAILLGISLGLVPAQYIRLKAIQATVERLEVYLEQAYLQRNGLEGSYHLDVKGAGTVEDPHVITATQNNATL